MASLLYEGIIASLVWLKQWANQKVDLSRVGVHIYEFSKKTYKTIF